jgi:hypothetical protein
VACLLLVAISISACRQQAEPAEIEWVWEPLRNATPDSSRFGPGDFEIQSILAIIRSRSTPTHLLPNLDPGHDPRFLTWESHMARRILNRAATFQALLDGRPSEVVGDAPGGERR